MKIQRGDVVFGQGGRPGVVLDRDTITGKLTVENQGEQYQKVRQHGFINGVPEKRRAEFSAILEEVKNTEDTMGKIDVLQKHIEELDKEPSNFQLVRYLVAERAHVMYSKGIQPQTYTIDEAKLNLA